MNTNRQIIYQIDESSLQELASLLIKKYKESLPHESESDSSNTNKDLLTIAEVADLLNVTPATIFNWSRQGLLRKIKIGRRAYFRRADVEKLSK